MDVKTVPDNGGNSIQNGMDFSDEVLSFELDGEETLEFENGTFSTVVTRDGQPKAKRIFWAPLAIKALVKHGEQWKVRYIFSDEEDTTPIETFASALQQRMHVPANKMSLFMQFFYKFKDYCVENNMYDIWRESVSVQDGRVVVENAPDQDIREILQILRDMAEMSTNRKAFLTSLYYCVLAPLSFEIRKEGQKFPYRLSCGRTHGGKTSIESLFVLHGFDQDIDKRKETLNTVKTIFTLGRKVEDSRLPFIVDDTNNHWLDTHAEELKGATDGVKFMVRGTRSQSRIEYRMYGMPVFTMNADPEIPLALMDRLIMSHYTEDHASRQNKAEFENMKRLLKPGFMLKIIDEVLGGKSIIEIIENVHLRVKLDVEINQKLISYSEGLVMELFRRYEITPPTQLAPLELTEQTLEEKFRVFALTKVRTQRIDNSIALKFCLIPKKDKEFVLVSTEGFNEFRHAHGFNKMSLTDFVNELRNPNITVNTYYSPCLKDRIRGILMPLSNEENKESPKPTIDNKDRQKLPIETEKQDDMDPRIDDLINPDVVDNLYEEG